MTADIPQHQAVTYERARSNRQSRPTQLSMLPRSIELLFSCVIPCDCHCVCEQVKCLPSIKCHKRRHPMSLLSMLLRSIELLFRCVIRSDVASRRQTRLQPFMTSSASSAPPHHLS